MKKIKLFLGAYVNSSNAQNLNCLALATHLNKDLFEVTTLSLYSEPKINLKGVKIQNCPWPHQLSVYIMFFWNILKADVVYLPKGELLAFNSFICRFLNKKSFTTIEGIFDQRNTQNAISVSGPRFIKYYHRYKKRYSITPFLKAYNLQKHALKTESQILYLGTETKRFYYKDKTNFDLKKLIMIGNDLVLKGVEHYFELAKDFKSLEFHLVGSGNDKIKVEKIIEKQNLKNVIYHGQLSQDQIAHLLKEMQLHLFPSRSEGFPKVILETACAGVPSMVYDDYGASDWLKHNHNGFIVHTFEQMKDSLFELLEHPKTLEKVSKNAIQFGLSYDWSNKIKPWEKVILELNEN